MSYEKNVLDSLVAVSTLSVCGSLAVILTPIIFRRMRDKLFMQIVAFISVGDILGNFPYMLPYREYTLNWYCDVQAFLHLLGYPIEWMWTAALVYLLYHLAVEGKVPRNLWPMHLLCWGLPLSLDFLTLSVTTYAPDNDSAGEVCTYRINKAAYVYHNVAYYGLFFASLFVMFVVYVRIHLLEAVSSKNENVRQPPFVVAKNALRWYPTILIVFWAPHMLQVVTPGTMFIAAYPYLLCWKICHGLATSFVFFYQSMESRRLWCAYIIIPALQAVLGRETVLWLIGGDEKLLLLTHRDSDHSLSSSNPDEASAASHRSHLGVTAAGAAGAAQSASNTVSPMSSRATSRGTIDIDDILDCDLRQYRLSQSPSVASDNPIITRITGSLCTSSVFSRNSDDAGGSPIRAVDISGDARKLQREGIQMV